MINEIKSPNGVRNPVRVFEKLIAYTKIEAIKWTKSNTGEYTFGTIGGSGILTRDRFELMIQTVLDGNLIFCYYHDDVGVTLFLDLYTTVSRSIGDSIIDVDELDKMVNKGT